MKVPLPSIVVALAGAMLILPVLDAMPREETQPSSQEKPPVMPSPSLARTILESKEMDQVIEKARRLVRTGLNAGEGYGEVWIRDLNTFIELALEENDPKVIRKSLLVFFHFQEATGGIIDGYIPASKAKVNYEYRLCPALPDLRGHKNTVETDQESSLVQAVAKYVHKTGDAGILDEAVSGKTVRERISLALRFPLKQRFSKTHGLIWGATTADWGDVQPEHTWGVVLDENSHRAIDIYDNALYLAALTDFLALPGTDPKDVERWRRVGAELAKNVREHLWDERNKKFIPHVYLEGSPFPDDFDENRIYYHGGTAVAIEAGLLSPEEVIASLAIMVRNRQLSGAATLGLTLYPPYPKGFFKNPSMVNPYSYQNGGDWTWFGARVIPQLVAYGLVEDAWRELLPMLQRVIRHDGFHEWWSVDNQPRGSGSFRGSAGVLVTAIRSLRKWARDPAQKNGLQKTEKEPPHRVNEGE